MKKVQVINYREKFKRYYGIDFSRDYDIHHIDLNHNNNNIENLMILPKELHRQYHFYLNATAMFDERFSRTFDIVIKGGDALGAAYNLNMLYGLINALRECAKWKDFKRYLDGEIPNIHNIRLNRYQEK